MPIDQDDVITWLSSPEAHQESDDQDGPSNRDGHDADVTRVERIDTHASIIFLSGSHAFKLKRAVRYDYLDYSTIARRRQCCMDEVRLNRRTAPMLYRGVQEVTRSSAGHFDLDGAGRVVDWLVVMNRFDRDAQLDERANQHVLSLGLMPPLAAAIAKLHDMAEWRFDFGGLEGLLWVVEGNREGFRKYGGDSLDATTYEQLSTTSWAIAQEHGHRLEARRRAGFVRHCHGDLHLGNICLIDGTPTLFDGVEFNSAIACVDVMYDVAFVLMDLLHRGLDRHANELFNGYLHHTDDLGSLGLLPLFLSLRAGVRAKTAATALAVQPETSARDALRETARQYLALARTSSFPAPRASSRSVAGRVLVSRRWHGASPLQSARGPVRSSYEATSSESVSSGCHSTIGSEPMAIRLESRVRSTGNWLRRQAWCYARGTPPSSTPCAVSRSSEPCCRTSPVATASRSADSGSRRLWRL